MLQNGLGRHEQGLFMERKKNNNNRKTKQTTTPAAPAKLEKQVGLLGRRWSRGCITASGCIKEFGYEEHGAGEKPQPKLGPQPPHREQC